MPKKLFSMSPYRGLHSFLAIATLLLLHGTQLAVSGPITLVTERSDIGAVETLRWDAVGKVLNPLAPNPADFLPLSFSVTTGLGLGVGVAVPPPRPVDPPPPISPPLVFQTLAPPAGIPTNFAPGDYVLFTGAKFGTFPAPGNPGPLSLRFDTPVSAVGTQVAVDDVLVYQLTLDVYDGLDNLLDSFTIGGTSSTRLDDSAAFLGAAADSPIIARIDYRSSEPLFAFGINDLSLRHDVVPVLPPLLLLGLPMLLLVRRCQTSRH